MLSCISMAQSTVKADDFIRELQGKWVLATDTNSVMDCHALKGNHLECNYSDGARMYLTYSEKNKMFNSLILKAGGESQLLQGYIADDRLVLEENNSRDNRTTGYRMIIIFIRGQIRCIEESKFNNSPWQQNADYYRVRIN